MKVPFVTSNVRKGTFVTPRFGGRYAHHVLEGNSKRDLPLRAEFARPVLLRTTNLDEARQVIGQNFYANFVDLLQPSAPLVGSIEVTRLGQVTIGDMRFGADIRMRFGELGAYHVDLPLAGTLAWHQGRNEPLPATLNRAAVFQPVGDTVLDHWSGDCRLLAIKVDRATLENELERLLDSPVSSPLRLAPLMDVSRGTGHSWAQLARLVVREAHIPEGLVHQPMVADRLQEALVTGLLLAVDHPHRETLMRAVPSCRPAPVKRAVDAIEAQPDSPFTVAALAQIAGVSVRCLQQGFQRYLDMSPMTYLRRVRLARAHDELRRSDSATMTVAQVAHRWGFLHLGRFALAYRKRYGVSPSTTLRGA